MERGKELDHLIAHLVKRCKETQGTGINPNKELFRNYYKQLREAYRVKKQAEMLLNGIMF